MHRILLFLVLPVWMLSGPASATEAPPDQAAVSPGQSAVEETPPAGVKMLLARGAIPAVVDPQFVKAKDAQISDDAWVLGVVVDGEARAYSIALLNHHEIVNDTIHGRPLAAVW